MHEELTRPDMSVIKSALVRVMQAEEDHDTYKRVHKVFCKVMRMDEKSREEWKRVTRGKILLRKLLHVLPGGA